MTFYLKENEVITQSANFKFNENCLETQEEIVRDKISGQLMLKSDYNKLISTEEHKKKVKAQENAVKKAEIQAQIEELDKKRIRAGFEPSIKDESTGQTWLEFYTQILALRAEMAEL